MADHCPHSPPAEAFAVRLSYSFIMIPEAFWLALNRFCVGVFATAHDDIEDNRHVHIALWRCEFSHDRLLKHLTKMVAEYIEIDHPTGNALMSVKKWDVHEKYLIYMLKGDRHEVCHNSMLDPMFRHSTLEELKPLLSASYIEYLRKQWEEGNDQKRAYHEWKASPFWPTIPRQTTEEFLMDTALRIPTIPFDTIREKAIGFSLTRYGGFLNAKVKHEVKDLVSNFCWFNKIKMGPLYI